MDKEVLELDTYECSSAYLKNKNKKPNPSNNLKIKK